MIDINEYIPVAEHPDLVKHPATGVILNINKNEASRVRKIREARAQEKQELENLKSDVRDIKAMLQQLIENSSNA